MINLPFSHHSRLSATLIAAAVLGVSGAAPARAEGSSSPVSVVITGSRTSQLGIADSANAGIVTRQQLDARTVYRPGELLEATPGLIVSQHSGEGKANQFYLRGFNLDHGTDLRTSVDGMLVNQRSHAHGQGWSDLNFLIPELADRLDYRKGPYYAEEGDFAAAGAVGVRYADKLADGVASVGLGQNGFRRTLLADSPRVGNGNLLYALELFHNDGPFLRGDDFRKANGVLRYSEGNAANGFNVGAMAYHGSWNASDQIPQRGLANGSVPDRFGAVDNSDGGNAHRYSLSGEWRNSGAAGATKVNAYIIANQLDLYSNFTYFLDDPLNGDQFSQPDRRVTSAVNASHTWQGEWLGRAMENRVGLQFQNDNIHNGLYNTAARRRLSTTRADHIVETSLGLFFDNSVRWSDTFRTVAGVRYDRYRFDVAGDQAANAGRASDGKASPKLSLVFGPWQRTEYYVNAGVGFHSNDARGTTIALDPKSGAAVDKVTPLVRSTGMELGLRSEWLPGLQSAFSLYRLDFDSELVFVGDAGTTEAGRPSRRTGFELSNYYKANKWLTIDADLAFAKARFRDADPAGRHIPGAVEGVASLALALDNLGPYFGALQLRYFGPRPLLEDNTVRSAPTATINGRIGYKINRRMKIELEGFNLGDRRDSAVDYYYTSRLAGEAAHGVADVHFHPIESRSFRMTLSSTF